MPDICMARLQWCRDHIDDVAENCCLSTDVVKEVKDVAMFCDEHAAFADLPTRPIRALIRIKDEQVRDRAISSVKKLLNLPKSQDTGRFIKSITEKEVKKIIEDVEIEVRNEAMDKEMAEVKADEERTGIHKITQDEVDVQLGITYEPAALVINSITREEIDLYFDVMKRIGCVEDIPKHKKRMDMMIENKTLLVWKKGR
jgi:uncharacterized surface protein with fasciclin (FAS1) repeats